MRKGLPSNGGRPFAFGTEKTRRGYPSPGFSGLIVSKFSYLISANIFSSAAAAASSSAPSQVTVMLSPPLTARPITAKIFLRSAVFSPLVSVTEQAKPLAALLSRPAGATQPCSCWKKSWIVCSQNTEIKHKKERQCGEYSALPLLLHAEQNLQRECALVIPYKNERDYLLK